MALLDTLKDAQDKKYISFWGLVSNIIAVDEERSDNSYASNETYPTTVEALLRLKLHEKVRYFIYDPDDFSFKQIDESKTDEAKLFLKMLLPKSGKKIVPTEVIRIQNQFKNYFWLKESIERVLPKDIVNFNDPIFVKAGEHQHLEVRASWIDDENLIELQRQNQRLQERISELEVNQGYLDPNNKFFSIEMKLCHDTWNQLYKNGNSSRLGHTKQTVNYLKNYPDFTVNTKAIKRIATITNPKHKLADTTDKEDI